jgi:hypothetical protein
MGLAQQILVPGLWLYACGSGGPPLGRCFSSDLVLRPGLLVGFR